MSYNPLSLRVCNDGVTRDKYGREFKFDEKTFRKRRKNSATPAYHAHINKDR